jgi:hypothetical protein
MTNRKIIIGLSVSLLAIIVLGLIIGLVIVPSLTNKEPSATTSPEPSELKHENDNPMVLKLILNSENKWTQSVSHFEIKNSVGDFITPEKYETELTKGQKIRINGITYDITDLKDSAMTIKRTQISV